MRYILVMTMPSGSRWALGPDPKAPPESREGIALYPISETTETFLGKVFGFDDYETAAAWMAEVSKLSEQGAKMMETVTPTKAEALQ